jgi:hypothetical protein
VRTSSAKAKGRRCSVEVADLLRLYAPDLRHDDLWITPSGVCGRDVCLSPAAQEVYPLAIECKNVEKLNVWEAYAQAEAHARGSDDYPIVFFKRNRSRLMVCLDAEHFMKMTR